MFPPPPAAPPRRGGWDPKKSYFPVRPGGAALLSQQVMEYKDVLQEAKCALADSEELCRRIDADFKTSAAQAMPSKALQFSKKTEEELRLREVAADEAYARAVAANQQLMEDQLRLSSNVSSHASNNIYSLTNNNPYTIGQRRPASSSNGNVANPPQPYYSPQPYGTYQNPQFGI